MKKIKVQKKVELNKRTVVDLKNGEMKKINGALDKVTLPYVSCWLICHD